MRKQCIYDIRIRVGVANFDSAEALLKSILKQVDLPCIRVTGPYAPTNEFEKDEDALRDIEKRKPVYSALHDGADIDDIDIQGPLDYPLIVPHMI